MAITPLGLDHLVLRVREPQRMIAFYRDVLGCPLDRAREDLGLWHLRAGRAFIDLISVDGQLGRAGGPAAGPKGRNLDHLCLRVEQFDEAAIRAHLARHGVAAGATVQRYGAEGAGPSIYLEDPEGNTVELKGPADPA
jgi:glyoxylase I family protein